MNTHGHHDIAGDAGLPELAAALAAAGKGTPRLGAFYLGNWLTDLAQLLDPLPVDSAEQKASEALEALAGATSELAGDVVAAFFVEESGGVPVDLLETIAASVRDETQQAVDDLRREIRASVRWFAETRRDRQEWLFGEIRNVIYLVGYFKFVHPLREGDSPRMHYPAYRAVFDERLTQYWPHDHLDRPAILPRSRAEQQARGDAPPDYRSEISRRARASGERLDPDLYAYLREQIEVNAGTLGEVELDWARTAFLPGAPADDTDLDWNLGLARFGFALHAVEDFFAHSNFVEHAALRLGEDYLQGRMSPFDEAVFLRRLKRWRASPPDDWTSLAPEPEVVSGFFTGGDTAFALLHLAEETLGLDVEDPFRDDPDRRLPEDEIDRAWEEAEKAASAAAQLAEAAAREAARAATRAPGSPEAEAAQKEATRLAADAARKAQEAARRAVDAAGRQISKTLFDTLAFVEDPEATLKEPNNRVLKFLREPYQKWKAQEAARERPPLSEAMALQVVTDAPLFAGLDAAVGADEAARLRARFVRAVVELSRTVATGRSGAAVLLSLFSVILAVVGVIFVQKRLISLLFRHLSKRIAKKYGQEVADALVTRILLYLAKRAVKKVTVGPLKRFVRKKVAEAVVGESAEALGNLLVFVARELVYERIGHYRVGHHTLLAKDHGRELLYTGMKDCARLVHWHLVRAMLRHAEPVSQARFVDWLALLEQFLRHPAATPPVAQSVASSVPVSVSHRARAGDTLLTLSKQYGRTAVDPARCTWETIADANFDTADLTPEQRAVVLRQELGSEPETGFRVPEGRLLLIPNQRFPIGTAAPADGEADLPWFETVLREGWRRFVPEAGEPEDSDRPKLPAPPLVDEATLRRRIAAARALRATLEQAYQPPAG